MYKFFQRVVCLSVLLSLLSFGLFGDELSTIKKRGYIRHLGVPYANFVTGSGDGLSVDLMKLFAKYLGVRYRYVKTDWGSVLSDLSGKSYTVYGNDIDIGSDVKIRGDIISNGLTMLEWRKKLVDYSKPTFLSQVWLVVRSDSKLNPIKPKSMEEDIANTKKLLNSITILSKSGTCLDPTLYAIEHKVRKSIDFKGSVNDLAPAIINAEAEATLLEIPDILMAMQKWPGKIKVIGPISQPQVMGVAFRKGSVRLQKEFAKFYEKIKKDGTYAKLVKKYYSSVFEYYPDFFRKQGILR